MRIRKSSLILGAVVLAMFAFYLFTSSDVQKLNEKSSLTSSELDSINGRIHKVKWPLNSGFSVLVGFQWFHYLLKFCTTTEMFFGY